MVEIMRSDTATKAPENWGRQLATLHNPALRIIDVGLTRSANAERQGG